MSSVEKMKDPLFVGKAIRAQLEHQIPKDLPLDRDFRVSSPSPSPPLLPSCFSLVLVVPTDTELQEGTDYTITDHVNALHAQLCPDPRTLEIFTALITHLHAFARSVRPTHAEWTKAVEYLTRAGRESTEFKNEFVLLSDCLGMSALVDEVNHPKPNVRFSIFSSFSSFSFSPYPFLPPPPISS